MVKISIEVIRRIVKAWVQVLRSSDEILVVVVEVFSLKLGFQFFAFAFE